MSSQHRLAVAPHLRKFVPSGRDLMDEWFHRIRPGWWPALSTDVSWQSVGSMAQARGFCGACLAGETIYTIGGEIPYGGAPLATVEAFDIQTRQSVTVPTLHLPLGRANAVVVGTASGRAYVIGGSDEHGIPCGTCYACDLPAGTWSIKAEMPQEVTCAAGAMGADGRIYVIGGITGGSSTRLVQRFDPAASAQGAWSEVHSLPDERFSAAAAVAGGKIYVFGGIDGAGVVIDRVDVYDPVADAWTASGQAMPTPRYDLSAVTGSNGRIYAIGGMRHCSAVDVVEEFDPATGQWAQMTPMATPRYGTAVVAATNRRIFVLGGWRKISGTFSETGAIEQGMLPLHLHG